MLVELESLLQKLPGKGKQQVGNAAFCLLSFVRDKNGNSQANGYVGFLM